MKRKCADINKKDKNSRDTSLSYDLHTTGSSPFVFEDDKELVKELSDVSRYIGKTLNK